MENELIRELGFEDSLVDVNDVAALYPNYADICKVGADRVYFSAGKPSAFFLEVFSFDNVGLKRIAQVQHNAWNYQRVMLLFVTSDVEIRIYNCYGIPVNVESELEERLDMLQIAGGKVEGDLDILVSLFSKKNIDFGTLWITEDDAVRKKIRLDQRVDSYLVKCMSEAAGLLGEKGLDTEIIHSLLMRSLFILFLEDKGAAREAGLYEDIKSGALSYFEILEDKEATYLLFKRLQEQFNGNITAMMPDEVAVVDETHLEIIRRCFFDGDFENELLFHERLFNFEIIHIGLISEIYENFLGELRREKGQFYTPFVLADMILSEVLPSSSKDYNHPLLDPACGSGVFLVEGYKRLIMRWKCAHPGQTISFETLVSLLMNNVFGVDIDPVAIRVAAFSLYLTLIDQLDPKILWNKGNHRLPYLIYDPDDATLKDKQGFNLLRKDTIKDVDANCFPPLKLIVGNPPYGTKKLSSVIKGYCQHEGFAMEYVLPFMHKATQICPNGDVALVFSSKVLFNTNGGYSQFRKWLLTKNKVRKIDNLSIFRKAPKSFGGSLFSAATCPVCVAYYSSGEPDENAMVKYCSPKTFVKSSLADGLLIDESDVKMLPVGECLRWDSRIWKIAAWGNYYGAQIIGRFTRISLKDYFDSNGWVYGRGLNADSQKKDFLPSPILNTECIARYWSDLTTACSNQTKRYRNVKDGLFDAPFVAFKQGQHNGEIACSLFMDKVFFTTTAFALNGGSLDDKKILTAYLNSRLAKYFLFLTTSSWGVEREQIFLNEVLGLPSPFDKLSQESKRIIVNAFDKIYQLSEEPLRDEIGIGKLEAIIEDELENAFGLTEKDRVYISDTLDFNLDIFQRKMESIGYSRVLVGDSKCYASTLMRAFDTLLEGIGFKVGVTVFDVHSYEPLQMVVLRLNVAEEEVNVGNWADFDDSLKQIDHFLTSKHSDGVYLRKTLKYYDGSVVYIIKPNQKRFWTRMQAYDDAAAIMNDILNM